MLDHVSTAAVTFSVEDIPESHYQVDYLTSNVWIFLQYRIMIKVQCLSNIISSFVVRKERQFGRRSVCHPFGLFLCTFSDGHDFSHIYHRWMVFRNRNITNNTIATNSNWMRRFVKKVNFNFIRIGNRNRLIDRV